METNLLETFVMVADAGGLSAAASRLSIPQSIVSRRIKELEMHCKAPLLYRHGRGVKLTSAGETLYHSAQPLVEQFKALISSVTAEATLPAGVVSVAISPALLSLVGLSLFDEVEKSHPQIRLHLISGYSRYVFEWLLQGRVDIGVLSDLGMSTQLQADELGAARVVLTAHRDFALPPDSKPGELDFAALASVPLVVPSRGLGLRRSIDLAASKAGVTLNIAHEVDDIELVKKMVARGRVSTLLTRLATIHEVASGEFVEKQCLFPEILASSVLGTARNRPITPAMKAVLPILKRVITATLKQHG